MLQRMLGVCCDPLRKVVEVQLAVHWASFGPMAFWLNLHTSAARVLWVLSLGTLPVPLGGHGVSGQGTFVFTSFPPLWEFLLFGLT